MSSYLLMRYDPYEGQQLAVSLHSLPNCIKIITDSQTYGLEIKTNEKALVERPNLIADALCKVKFEVVSFAC